MVDGTYRHCSRSRVCVGVLEGMEMMKQHTPGPWIVTEQRHPYKDGSKAHIERNIYTERDHPQLKGKYPIACMSVGIGMDGEKAVQFVRIGEADARLIAAAPDLLEALKNLLEAHYNGNVIKSDCLDAEAAIAKATGEQP